MIRIHSADFMEAQITTASDRGRNKRSIELPDLAALVALMATHPESLIIKMNGDTLEIMVYDDYVE